jgi:hypothetical protein
MVDPDASGLAEFVRESVSWTLVIMLFRASSSVAEGYPRVG